MRIPRSLVLRLPSLAFLHGILVAFLSATTFAEEVTFRHEPSQNGQRIWQHVTVFADTMTTYEQGGQKISQEHRYYTKEQIRRVTVLDARPGPDHRVQVLFEKAQETRTARGKAPKIKLQPVQGKTYIVQRVEDQLNVLDEGGRPADEQEASIVRESMQFVGRPNPLALFLHGRTVSVGESLLLPRDTAESLVGWKESFGSVDSVAITLKETDATGIAIFETQIEGRPVPELNNRTRMTGQLHITPEACRTVATHLKADLAVHETRGPQGHTFTVSHEGQSNIHTQARLLQR